MSERLRMLLLFDWLGCVSEKAFGCEHILLYEREEGSGFLGAVKSTCACSPRCAERAME
jgi:hypothetical protein